MQWTKRVLTYLLRKICVLGNHVLGEVWCKLSVCDQLNLPATTCIPWFATDYSIIPSHTVAKAKLTLTTFSPQLGYEVSCK